jgi:hypothetical protein
VAPYLEPTPIFHITAIDNLRSIATTGALLAKRLVVEQQIDAADIAYEGVQGRRAVKVVPVAPGGTLHEYVPFYFAPRSPMLFTINNGNVEGCDYRQDDIVHLASHAQTIRDGGHTFAFSNLHAVKGFAEFFNDLSRLDQIDWSVFFEAPLIEGFCQYWHSRPDPARHALRQESRMAEFLVHQQVPIAAIWEIGVRTNQGETRVRAVLEGTGWQPNVRVVSGWYF